MTTRSKEFTGRHMLFLVVGFFGVIFAVNAGMAVVASTSWTGLVVTNSYVASQEFETRRLAHEAQQAAGWTASLDIVSGTARLSIVDVGGDPVDLGSVSLALNRPVGGHDDQSVQLERQPAGDYAAPVQLATGVWDALVIAADTPLGPFELRRRLRLGETP